VFPVGEGFFNPPTKPIMGETSMETRVTKRAAPVLFERLAVIHS